ncbi:MAG: ubiquitin-protein ligase [Crocinitomix sp.]
MRLVGLVSILVLFAASCSNEYELEDQFCDCYREHALIDNLNFDSLVQRIEQHYIDGAILQPNDGGSYYENVKILANNEFFSSSLINYQEIQTEIVLLSQIRDNSNCEHLMTASEDNSRIYKLQKRALHALLKGTLNESVWQIHADELTAQDYDHIFFKADYFIVDYSAFINGFYENMLLPLKVDFPEKAPLAIDKRNVLDIVADGQNVIQVNGVITSIEDLKSTVLNFYQANIDWTDNDPDMPTYQGIDKEMCHFKIDSLKGELAVDSLNKFAKSDLNKWESRLELTTYIKNEVYMEISNNAVINLTNNAGTSYGLYIEIQNILKSVVNDLRSAKCEELGWPDYFELRESDAEDHKYIKMLCILVPERIVESKIDR